MKRNAPLSIRLISALLIPVYASINIIPGPVCAGENSIAVLEYGIDTGSPESDLWREALELIENDPLLLMLSPEL